MSVPNGSYFACEQAILQRLAANWSSSPIVYSDETYVPAGSNNIVMVNDISASSSDNSLNSVSSAFFGIVSGQFAVVSGFSNAANNGYFKIITATASKITISSVLVNEAISPSKTIAVNDQANPFIYVEIDFNASNLVSLGSTSLSPTGYQGQYRHYGTIFINILTPVDQGIGDGLKYADTISSVFRGQTFNNVLCSTPLLDVKRQVKFPTGNWWSTPLTCPFKYNVVY